MRGLRCTLPGVMLLLALDAAASTMAEVDQLVEKANASLCGSSANRAQVLSDAIANCQEALSLLEKVGGVSEDERQKKATEIMSTIFWCSKMMPLDLRGRQVSTGSGAGEKGPTSGTDSGGAGPSRARTGKDLDEVAFSRARAYASKNSQDLEGALLRFEGVAASYPRSRWGKRAAAEAGKLRARLDKLRAAAATAFRDHLDRLDFAGALAALDETISKETLRAKRTQLERAKEDVEAVRLVWRRVVTALEKRGLPLALPFGEIGLEKKAWVKGGSEKAVLASAGSKNASPTPMPWSEFRARGVLRMAEKLLNLHDAESLKQVAVAATVAGDYIAAQAHFEKLLRMDPRRLNSVANYAERAFSGYRNTAEGGATIRFKEAKGLVKKKDFARAMSILAALQKDLAKNSTLQELLAEIDKYRRHVRRRYDIDDQGNPITAFERKVRKVFGGDVRLDEGSGKIEVLYDFSETAQLRDWLVVDGRMKPSSVGGWTVQSGACKCLGKGRLLMWRFPLIEFDVRADVVYEDRTGRVRTVIHSCMTKANPYGVWAWCRNGEARLNEGRVSSFGWYSSARFIWRPGEVAILHYRLDPRSAWPFRLTVNGQYAVSGQERQTPGCIAFNFDGGRGSVDNVEIKGVLDRKLMRQIVGVR